MATNNLVQIPADLLVLFVQLLSGLDVPVSMSMPLGKADAAYRALRSNLDLFGWLSEEEILAAIKRHTDKLLREERDV